MGTEASAQRITIRAGAASHTYWLDLWRYRALILQLAWRDIRLRYRQTILGVTWIVARPVCTTAALVLVFGSLAKLPSEGIPYPVFVAAAIVPWQFATSGLLAMSSSVVSNSNLVGKIYFPRLIIPLSSLGSSVLDLLVSVALFAGVTAWYGYPVSANLVFAPLFILLALGLVVGSGLWLSVLSVRYRDVIQGLPFLVQFGLYFSPVGYGTSLIPDRFKFLFTLNPITGVIEGFRWASLGVAPHWPSVWVSLAFALVAIVTGLWFFRSREDSFADVI